MCHEKLVVLYIALYRHTPKQEILANTRLNRLEIDADVLSGLIPMALSIISTQPNWK